MHATHFLAVAIEFAIVLGIMVLVHEFGHFAVAKLCGVRVETFSIGFGPRLIGFRRGDTDYRLSLLPLGGYVKMAGDNPAEERRLDESIDVHGAAHPHDPAEFNARPRWQRVLIALAGPFANFLLSFFLLLFMAKFHHEVDQYLAGPATVDYVAQNSAASKIGIVPGDVITYFAKDKNPTWQRILEDCNLHLHHDVPVHFTHQGHEVQTTLHIEYDGTNNEFMPQDLFALGLLPAMQPSVGVMNVTPGDPAAKAGIEAGDELVAIDSVQVHSVATLLAYLRDRNGAPSIVHLVRHGQPVDLSVTPQKIDSGGDTQYRLGFQPAPLPVQVVELSLPEAIKQSVKDNRDDSTLIVRVIKGMFTRQVSVRSLSGPVGIAQQIDLATQMGAWTLVRLMSTISLNLGIFNLLPMPLLDGGMIVFLLIEAAMRRDLNQTIKERVYQVAFVCLILFAAFVLFNDITKLHIRP